MSQKYNGEHRLSDKRNEDDLERLLSEGVTFSDEPHETATRAPSAHDEEDETEDTPQDGDLQGALALFAEATQDMATASVELGLGRHFACVDFCNQAVEKAAQSVSMLHLGHRSMYDHDLAKLGATVGAPAHIQQEMALLTPFHPEAFYAGTPPEEADEVISAEQASEFVQHARTVLRWAKSIVLNA